MKKTKSQATAATTKHSSKKTQARREPRPPRLSAKQVRFAQIYVTGKSATEAYQEVYGCKTRVAEACASRLLSNAKVSEYVDGLRQAAAGEAVITLRTLLEFLTRGIVTPLGRVDEESDLCQGAEYQVMGGTRGRLRRGKAESGNEKDEPEMTTVKIKMLDKLRAAELVAKLQGWLTEKVDVDHGADRGLIELLELIGNK